MKIAVVILALVLPTQFLRAEVRLFRWQESRDAKTGEQISGFFLAPRAVMEALEADARGDSRPAKALEGKPADELWDYGLLLKGEGTTFPKEKLVLFEPSPCGSALQIDTGSVEIDRKKGVVRVALKVIQDGKLIDFRGNGVYHVPMAPNHSAEPTAGAVH